MGEGEKGKEVFLSILPLHHAYGLTLGMNLPSFGRSKRASAAVRTGQVLANIHKQKSRSSRLTIYG